MIYFEKETEYFQAVERLNQHLQIPISRRSTMYGQEIYILEKHVADAATAWVAAIQEVNYSYFLKPWIQRRSQEVA